ncbi:phosphatidylinositol N-acetylglucosaminyltransferase subunit A [Citrus sinensis]|uniref:Phosphatidylinositol N-acetylglucosaminyltransferase subunit A n=1 Tax=Citrus sinensis TaxID=2711 RepID=A0ACB8KBY4_CITSI|nr:phosphatidylinositol N-acetylglucosaminyltransferase subunit A [Citrus sinensis]
MANQKHRILMVSDFFYPNFGGVENHIYYLSQCLLKFGHKVVVMTHAYGNRSGVRYMTGGLKVYYVPWRPFIMQNTLPTFYGTLPIIRTILIREKISLVHGHQAFSTLCHEALMHARTMGYRVVFTDHSLYGFADVGSIHMNKVLQFTLADVSQAICVSHTSKENTVLRSGLPPQKVFVVPNAVDTAMFKPAPERPGSNEIIIVVISRLVYRKGADLLVEVIPEVCRCYPNSKNPETMSSKKVDALEEKLEAEIGSLKATIDERFNNVLQKFSSLEPMLLKLIDLHLNPPLAVSTGQDGVVVEGSGDTKPVLGNGTDCGGSKTTSLAQPRAIVHGGFGGGEVSLGDLRPRGAFPGVGCGEGGWVAAGGSGSEGYAAGGGSLGLGIGASASEWGAQDSGVDGLGDLATFEGDTQPGQAEFWAGQGCCGPGQAGFGPGQGDFGSGQVIFRGGWPGRGVTCKKGSGYDRNAVGRGISAQYGAGQGEFWTQFGADSRVRKLKMPIFEGEDAYGWVYRVECYFTINGLSEREKLMAAALCLEGKERTVMEYRKKFELLSGRLGDISKAVLEGNFMKGLKQEIRASHLGMRVKVRFIVGGDGPKRVRLEEMREKHSLQDRVEMLGAVPHAQVRSVLISGHIFLNSSLTEAFCIAILEAASCGLLTVSTRVGGVPEACIMRCFCYTWPFLLVLPDDMVVLAEPDPGDMVLAIRKAISLLPKIDPQVMHERMKKLYNWHDVAKRTEIVYDRALECPNQNLVERLSRLQLADAIMFVRYLSCGAWAGKLFCLVMIIDYLLWRFLELWKPAEDIEEVPDIVLPCQSDGESLKDCSEDQCLRERGFWSLPGLPTQLGLPVLFH